MAKKIIIYILLSIICMIAIFSLSNKNTTQSNHMSKKLLYHVVTMYEKVSHHSVDKEELIDKLNYPIRKLAHFSIYFLLGIFVYQVALLLDVKQKELVATMICMIYAVTDEIHQLFVLGRTAQVLDIVIDTCGSLVAILLIRAIRKKIKVMKKFS